MTLNDLKGHFSHWQWQYRKQYCTYRLL